jgi:hypothetical protein
MIFVPERHYPIEGFGVSRLTRDEDEIKEFIAAGPPS